MKTPTSPTDAEAYALLDEIEADEASLDPEAEEAASGGAEDAE